MIFYSGHLCRCSTKSNDDPTVRHKHHKSNNASYSDQQNPKQFYDYN